MDIYDFKVKSQNGDTVALENYRGKLLLIVNTATGCGFTPQCDELQDIYETYHKNGLEILDFPCNQFGGRAPGSDEDIHSFCTGRFGITFPQFAKIDVIGEHADPLFLWLSQNSSFDGFGINPMGLAMNSVLKKIEAKLLGNTCGGRPTSCTDQLARALRNACDSSHPV